MSLTWDSETSEKVFCSNGQPVAIVLYCELCMYASCLYIYLWSISGLQGADILVVAHLGRRPRHRVGTLCHSTITVLSTTATVFVVLVPFLVET